MHHYVSFLRLTTSARFIAALSMACRMTGGNCRKGIRNHVAKNVLEKIRICRGFPGDCWPWLISEAGPID
jgi:hypothetical protein